MNDGILSSYCRWDLYVLQPRNSFLAIAKGIAGSKELQNATKKQEPSNGCISPAPLNPSLVIDFFLTTAPQNRGYGP